MLFWAMKRVDGLLLTKVQIKAVSYLDLSIWKFFKYAGKCFLRAIKECFPSLDCDIDEAMGVIIEPHYAPVFGLLCRMMGISMSLCERMFLRMHLRDLVSAAVRLNIIGPMEGVRVQAQTFPLLEELLKMPIVPARFEFIVHGRICCKDLIVTNTTV